jgi:hypothetical protein
VADRRGRPRVWTGQPEPQLPASSRCWPGCHPVTAPIAARRDPPADPRGARPGPSSEGRPGPCRLPIGPTARQAAAASEIRFPRGRLPPTRGRDCPEQPYAHPPPAVTRGLPGRRRAIAGTSVRGNKATGRDCTGLARQAHVGRTERVSHDWGLPPGRQTAVAQRAGEPVDRSRPSGRPTGAAALSYAGMRILDDRLQPRKLAPPATHRTPCRARDQASP